jgi:hypothetical protein
MSKLKQIMTYVDFNNQSFNQNLFKYIKMQIDISKLYGWDPDDIIIVSNKPLFNINSLNIVVSEDFSKYNRSLIQKSTKINLIEKLFDMNKIEKEATYWFHDFDAYQNHEFDMNDIVGDACFTTYTHKAIFINTGSFFFNINAYDIFKTIKNYILEFNLKGEEPAVTKLFNEKKFDGRLKRIPKTYNASWKHKKSKVDIDGFDITYPLRVIHAYTPIKYKTEIEENLYDMINPNVRNIVKRYFP